MRAVSSLSRAFAREYNVFVVPSHLGVYFFAPALRDSGGDSLSLRVCPNPGDSPAYTPPPPHSCPPHP